MKTPIYAKEYMTEKVIAFGRNLESDGFYADEQIILKRCDDGGGAFVSMKTVNYNPDEDYDEHTVTLSGAIWEQVKKMIDDFIREMERED